MQTESGRWIGVAIGFALLVTFRGAFALGTDYPNNSPVPGSTNWPKGMEKLVNTTNRVHGFDVNGADTFFFSGSASAFTAFLRDYSHLDRVESRRLILHDGIGEAKSPWDKTGPACDWKLCASPKTWQAGAPYVVEVHFWTGGRIALDQIDVPKNVVVQR